ncbi:MAG TPA: outer membrane beta-barrel protein [Bacteroidales bacterium]|nr:outer membrane beta-barrel protein [Bacteroidales bacterium]
MSYKRYFSKACYILPFILLAIAAFPAKSQSYTSVNYNMSFPVSLAGDYIKDPGFQGLNIEFGYYLTDHFSLGIRAGWHSFYEERSAQEYTRENVTLYGKQFRYIDSYPVMISTRYTFGMVDDTEAALVTPYAGLGLGGYSFIRRTDMGIYSFSDDKTWHFGLQPEAGVLISLFRKAAINIGLRYNQMFKNSDNGSNGYLGVQAGLQLYPGRM